MKILQVLTSHDQLGNTGRKTGFWLQEFASVPPPAAALILCNDGRRCLLRRLPENLR